MLTLTDARGFVNNSAYFARGRVYAQEGRVHSMTHRKLTDGVVELTAKVRGAGAVYKTVARFDAQRLHTCSCSCAAFARTGDMCKHVAALLIAFCDQQSAESRQAKEEAERREAARLEAERRESEAQQQKDLFLDTLLHLQDRKRADNVRLRHEAAGDVRICPVLVCENGGVFLELKIGRGRLYVVRSLAQFAACAKSGGCEVYGKELTFSHTEEELHPDDVAIYHCIVSACAQEQGRGPRTRLEGAQLDALMRLLIGREVEMRLPDAPSVMAKVVEGEGSLTGGLAPQAGGHMLTLSAENAVCGARGAYFFCHAEGEIRCVLGRRFSVLAPLFQVAERYPAGLLLEGSQLDEVAKKLLVPAGAGLVMEKGREILLSLTPMAMRPRFLIDMQGRGRLTCEVQHDYGAVVLGAGEQNPHIRRDTLAEEEAALCASRLFPKEDSPGMYAFEGKEDAVFDLLSERLTELKKDGEVMIAERLKQLNVQARRTMTFGVTKEGTQLQVKADLGGLSQPELEAAYAAYRQKKLPSSMTQIQKSRKRSCLPGSEADRYAY